MIDWKKMVGWCHRMLDYVAIMRELREDNDLTQKEVAAYLEIDQRTYSRYECGVNLLPLHLLVKLCDYYSVSADYLLGRSKKKR